MMMRMRMRIGTVSAVDFIGRCAVVGFVCLQAACSTYKGPITNAPPPTGLDGLPGLTNYYAP